MDFIFSGKNDLIRYTFYVLPMISHMSSFVYEIITVPVKGFSVSIFEDERLF